MGLGDVFKKKLDESAKAADSVIQHSASARTIKRMRLGEDATEAELFVHNDDSKFNFEDSFFLETASVTDDDDEGASPSLAAGAAEAGAAAPGMAKSEGPKTSEASDWRRRSRSFFLLDVCDHCGSTNTRVVKDMRQFDGRIITRHCDDCGNDWTRVFV